MSMGSLRLAEAPSSSQCHSYDHGARGERVGEKAAKWHNHAVDTKESTQESNGAVSQMGKSFLCQLAPADPGEPAASCGISQQTLTKASPGDCS